MSEKPTRTSFDNSAARGSSNSPGHRRRIADLPRFKIDSPVVKAGLLFVLTLLVYAPARQGGFIVDDNLLITENPLIKAADGLYRIWFTTEAVDYWPVVNSSFWIEWRLWGLNPAGYHLTNFVLHAVDALLLWWLLERMAIPGAYLAALLFALHPVNVESVAWISQRKNLLSMTFSLFSVLCFLRCRNSARSAEKGATLDGFSADPWYWLSLGSFVLAMLSKASIAILPLLLLGILWWENRLNRTGWRAIAPFLLISLVLVGVNVWFQARFTRPDTIVTSLGQRALGAGAVIWFYLYKALLPIQLAFVYPKWQIDPGKLIWWLPAGAAAIASGGLWWLRRGTFRPIAFAWFVFVVSLIPVMGFTEVAFMQHSLVADHYQHVALIAVVTLLAAGLTRAGQRPPFDSIAPFVAAGIVAALMIQALQQSGNYVDGLTLYRASLAVNPESAFAENNLALEYQKLDESESAAVHFAKAIQLKPDFPEAHFNLARLYAKEDRLDEAIAHYREAVRGRPFYAEYHYELGSVLARRGQLEEAMNELKSALQRRPDFAEAENDLGAALLESGKTSEAIEHFEKAIRLQPGFADAHANLARSLARSERLPEAIHHYQEALKSRPEAAGFHNDLAVTLAQSRRIPEAIREFQKALELDPGNRNAAENLNEVLSTQSKANADDSPSAEATGSAKSGPPL